MSTTYWDGSVAAVAEASDSYWRFNSPTFGYGQPLVLTASGAADEWLRIQNALNYLDSLGGGSLCLRGGTFKIGQHLVINGSNIDFFTDDGSILQATKQLGKSNFTISHSIVIPGTDAGGGFIADLANQRLTPTVASSGDQPRRFGERLWCYGVNGATLPAPLEPDTPYYVVAQPQDNTDAFLLDTTPTGAGIAITDAGSVGGNFITAENIFISSGVNTTTGEITYLQDVTFSDGELVFIRGWPTLTSAPTGLVAGVNAWKWYSFHKTDTNKGIFCNTKGGAAVIPSDQGDSTQAYAVSHVPTGQKVRGFTFSNLVADDGSYGVNLAISTRMTCGALLDGLSADMQKLGNDTFGVISLRGASGTLSNSSLTVRSNQAAGAALNFSIGQATTRWSVVFNTFVKSGTAPAISLNSATTKNTIESNTLNSLTVSDSGTGNLVGTNF